MVWPPWFKHDQRRWYAPFGGLHVTPWAMIELQDLGVTLLSLAGVGALMDTKSPNVYTN